MKKSRLQPSTFLFEDDGKIPNNPQLPLLFYAGAFGRETVDADLIEDTFRQNQWGGSWRSSVFSYPHYHAEAHEALGCFRGTAVIRLGGSNGIEQKVQPGDVVVIPAGVGHENLGSSGNFTVVGAYPPGQSPDLQRGEPAERSWAMESIGKVPLPPTDPVFGKDGPLNELWTPA